MDYYSNTIYKISQLWQFHFKNYEYRAFPNDISLPSTETRNKTVVFCHGECTFQANDDQTRQWGRKGEFTIRPKSKGSGIMVSDFIDERNGYLRLTDEEFTQAQTKDPSIRQEARQLIRRE